MFVGVSFGFKVGVVRVLMGWSLVGVGGVIL